MMISNHGMICYMDLFSVGDFHIVVIISKTWNKNVFGIKGLASGSLMLV